MASTGQDEIETRAVGEASWWRSNLLPALVAAGALALAVGGGFLTTLGEGVGGLNIFVESTAGLAATAVGNAGSLLPLGFAFGAGLVSTVNPCGFAMLPAYLGLYVGSEDPGDGHASIVPRLARALLVAGTVTAGFVFLFGLAGVAIGAGARFLVGVFPWVGLAIGVTLVVAGALVLRGTKLYTGMAARAAGRMGDPSRIGPRGYFVFGLSYGLASLSCTLPIFLAVVGNTLTVDGLVPSIAQFVLYGAGMGLMITLLTVAVALFKGAIIGRVRGALPYVQPVSAVLMVVAGAYIVFYWLTIGGLLNGIT